mgnify:CR=1 FL=1
MPATFDVLELFEPQVAGWFAESFAQPTAVQESAWRTIAAGENALVVAPTGSGKTLAAFLWSLNRLATQPRREPGVKVLYISPLKALGVDVENNLRAPLAGIARVAARDGLPSPEISVAVRSGDTPAGERARQLRNPSDILITTPESLYLMLTSKAADILRSVEVVIVDEIHALAGTKRGVHLSLSLERLARIAGDFQRIGLSATVRPLTTVADFLGPKTAIVNPPAEKQWQLTVSVPVEDMNDLPLLTEPGDDWSTDDAARNRSIWPHIEQAIYQQVMAHRSTIIFVNARRTAERLTNQLNEIWAKEHDPDSLSPQLRRTPAQLMKAVDIAGTAPPVIARAHHGSVSKEERQLTESMLKDGSLRAVVATSSLELGIDMGAVDLVIQVESPPSVAAGLQRVGRAGHAVGAVSEGTIYPKHRSDLVTAAVTVTRMRAGQIEELHVPANPLDVLTQQTVAAVAVEDLDVDQWYATVRRAYPYRDLDRDVFDAVIELVIGQFPSTDFAELRPRAILDGRTLRARPGAQRVAVSNVGTIPDRGMFGVFILGGADAAPRRVGELDEEMVYESRVGDVFTLGASSWRIENITRDQVQVSPAPGHTGRLPFWSGDSLGRPYELGRAIGEFRRTVLSDGQPIPGLAESLDENARNNLAQYLDEQRQATGVVPDEKTLLLERFTDELGDWRVVLHTPFGKGVNAAWALAVGARVSANSGMDAQAVAGDDGIVLRLPQGEADPDASLFSFDRDEIVDIVTQQVGGSALFAARFRECAARALLLPKRDPSRRAPLWQQRQRAEQLLDVARQHPRFPIILETMRECLQDVYDLPALSEVMADLQARRIRIAEVTTSLPSPFATSLLFSYTGAFMYEGDSPLAEKRAAALTLDPALLAKLLGTVEMRELLDPEIIAEVDAQLRRVGRAESAEQFADTLRITGPVPVEDLATYATLPAAELLAELGPRVMTVRIAGREHLAQSFDAALLRDGLGIPVPAGVAVQAEIIPDALNQLVNRWTRTRGPFTVRELANAFGLGVGVASALIEPLTASGKLIEGRFRADVDEPELLAADVLRLIRSRSLAAVRASIAPVSASAYGRFLSSWSSVSAVGEQPGLRGTDGLYAALEQLAGARLPASAWEAIVLPSRVEDYRPEMLDELTASGEIIIVGAGKAGARDPWLMLLPNDFAAQLVERPETPSLSDVQTQIMSQVSVGGGYLFNDLLAMAVLAEQDGTPRFTGPEQLREEIWGLVEAGLISPDSMAPVRARLGYGRVAHRASRRPTRSRIRSGRTAFNSNTPTDMIGRWAASPVPELDATKRSVALGEAWLDRYGVVTRGSIVAEDVMGGFSLAYKTLAGFEESGKAIRGHFIAGLGAAQFSTPAAIDRLRACQDSPDVDGWPSGSTSPKVYVLAACDPANPYGAALPWPVSGPTRSAGSLVILVDGLLAGYLTRGGRQLSTFVETFPDGVGDPLPLIIDALASQVEAGRLSALHVEKWNGEPAFGLAAYGATMTHKGARIGVTSVRRQPPRSAPADDFDANDVNAWLAGDDA